jgi:opacity protein-like surface antigen
MIKMSRIAVVAAVAATALSSPTFAQSFGPQHGAGNTSTSSFPATIGQNSRMAHRVHVRGRAPAPRSGLHAFAATIPNTYSPALNPFSPALTGGGSAGYNENLRTDTW